jgi:hypothetical protein
MINQKLMKEGRQLRQHLYQAGVYYFPLTQRIHYKQIKYEILG